MKVPVQNYIYNERTMDNDPFQILTLNVRFGTTMVNRIHFTPHLIARCALFFNQDISEYLHVSISSGVYQDIVSCAKRELQRIVDGICPYEIEAERLSKNDSNALRCTEEFFYEEKWPSKELRDKIEQIFSVQQAMTRALK